jgi:Dolichyl-phosphate-mannose-protein mannosyltransferase
MARAGVVLLVGYFLTVGFLGLDFGYHWDEAQHVRAVKHCIETLTWLPPTYSYNGVYTLLGLPFVLLKAAPLFPRILHALALEDVNHIEQFTSSPVILELKGVLRAYVESPAYLLRVRGLYLVLSSLAIPWTYLAAATVHPRRPLIALVAAAFVALSWEFGYHARFVAVDAPLTQFLAMELWMFARAWRATLPAAARRWALAATGAAAGALACKSTAVFAVLPLAALVLHRPALPRSDRLKTGAAMAGVYLAVTFVLTPGLFLEPIRYLSEMARQRLIFGNYDYSSFPYFTPGPRDHAYRAALWLLLAVPSPFHVVAILLSSLMLIGCVDRLRSDGAVRVWTVYALLFFVFIAQYHLLMVRQHLVALPFMAILVAAGARVLSDLANPWIRRSLAAGLAIGFALNAVFCARAAASIRSATPKSVLRDFQRDIARARVPFRLSPDLFEALGSDVEHARCVPATWPQTATDFPRTVYFFYNHELFWKGHVNNGPDGLSAFYGPRDANYDWYITFVGKMERERIVGVSSKQANAMELDMAGYRDCAPKP